jgi:hypothetical protein
VDHSEPSSTSSPATPPARGTDNTDAASGSEITVAVDRWELARREAIEEQKLELRRLVSLHPQVAKIVISYNAYGDSGQVEDVSITGSANATLDIPELTAWGHRFGWDYPYQQHPGFENEAGASGEVVIDVAAGRISLDHRWSLETYELESTGEVL